MRSACTWNGCRCSFGQISQRLSGYPQDQFLFGNDEPGQKAEQQMMEKYKELGYSVTGRIVPSEYKDVNEWLRAERKRMVDSTFRYQREKKI